MSLCPMPGSFAHPGMSPQRSMGEPAFAVLVAHHRRVLAWGEVVARAKVQGRARGAQAQERVHLAPREALCKSATHGLETTGHDGAGTSTSRGRGALIATGLVMEDGRIGPSGTVPLRPGLVPTARGIVT